MVHISNGDRPHTNLTDNQNDTIRILIVDDQKMIREGLKALIKTESHLEVVGTAENGEDGIKKVEILKPDVVLMDMEMPGMDGVRATQAICQKFPNVKVLVLSTFDNQEYVTRSLSSGAMGYLLKGTPAKELTTAIQAVYLGYAQIGPGVYQNLPLTPQGETKKLPTNATFSSNGNSLSDPEALSPRLNGQLAKLGDSDVESSALTIKQQSALAPRKFEQTVLLRQSPKWSRATVWAVAGVTVFAIGWSIIAKVEQVVPAVGQLKPQDDVKEIQVPTNGVVEEVKVEKGQKVKKGDILLVLDATTSKAQVESLTNVRQYLSQENKFYRALMKGEIPTNEVEAAITKLEIPREIAFLARNRAQLISENQLYRAQLGIDSGKLNPQQEVRLRTAQAEYRSRVAAARLEVEQLEKQFNQNQLQLADAKEQLATARQVLQEIRQRNEQSIAQAEESLRIEEKTLNSIAPLVEEGALAGLQLDRQQQEVNDRRADLIESRARGRIEYNNQQQEVITTQAEIERLQEEQKRLTLDIAQAKEELINTTAFSEKDTLDNIAENEQRIADIDTQLNRNTVENDKRIQEINSQISSAKQTLKYQTISAPISGTIFDLQAYPGYVPPAGQAAQPVLKIVPDDKLVAEVFIKPEDIGFVKEGMNTDVRISSFPFGEYGDIKGTLTYVGGSSLEPDNQPPYNFVRFPAVVELDQQYMNINGRQQPLQSGMSIQVNIRVRENRTVMSLLFEKFFTPLEKFKEL